jgi:RimJ/RimL family protein N-acetyltransferase
MEIRFLAGNDANQYWRLRLESLERDPDAFRSSVEEHRALSMEEVARRLGMGEAEQFVVGALEDGRLLGTAGFYRDKGPKVRHKGRVWGGYVTAAPRGSGLGKRMLHKVLERATAIEGIEQVLLSVATTHTAATQLYGSLGFVPFGREPRALLVNGCFIDEEYMGFELTGSRGCQDR